LAPFIPQNVQQLLHRSFSNHASMGQETFSQNQY
jgi:hypothetical protein